MGNKLRSAEGWHCVIAYMNLVIFRYSVIAGIKQGLADIESGKTRP
ncbi:MAG: hypothetical protein QNJ18_18885 [Xenococcaceae cyanobacterium MO_167.B52]|nr:hypothetical protein [Xenococcaceae cyanobacterium MO_167.B52]